MMLDMVYLAHPMDQSEDAATAMILEARTELGRAGISFFEWQVAFSLAGGSRPQRAIARVNEAAQRSADATLALLPDGVPTLGTPAEIERALSWGQPVAIAVGSKTRRTVQVAEWILQGAEVGTSIAALVRGWLSYIEPGGPPGVLKVTGDGPVPTQSYEGDAGFDLYYHGTDVIEVKPGEWTDIPAGLQMEPPRGTWCMIVGRSSTYAKGLLVNTSIIDWGWRGDLFALVRCIGNDPVTVVPGDRIAQLIPLPLLAPSMVIEKVDRLAPSKRGTAGFGSSGR